jgi:large subunit ribosomal protein L49
MSGNMISRTSGLVNRAGAVLANHVAAGGVFAVQMRSRSMYNEKQRRSRFVVHAAYKPAENAMIDFSTLGLAYPCTVVPKTVIKSNMWTSPPAAGEAPVGLPFAVSRTALGQSLPVYTEYKGGRTKVVTVVRRIRGDVDALKEELEKVCEGAEIDIRLGKVVITGNYHGRVKMYFSGLGF